MKLIHKPFSARKPGWREGFLQVAARAEGGNSAVQPRVSPIRRISLVPARASA